MEHLRNAAAGLHQFLTTGPKPFYDAEIAPYLDILAAVIFASWMVATYLPHTPDRARWDLRLFLCLPIVAIGTGAIIYRITPHEAVTGNFVAQRAEPSITGSKLIDEPDLQACWTDPMITGEADGSSIEKTCPAQPATPGFSGMEQTRPIPPDSDSGSSMPKPRRWITIEWSNKSDKQDKNN